MGNLVASIKVFPESPDIDLAQLRRRIEAAMPQSTRLHSYSEEPIAFGLEALILNLVMPEGLEGEMERIERLIAKVEGVSEIEILMVRRA